MRLQLHIALRNLRRNPRRTALSLAIIALGGAMTFMVLGYTGETYLQLRQAAVFQYGHLQVASSLYWDQDFDGFKYLISPEALDQIHRLLRDQPQVEAFTSELGLMGLASNGRKSQLLQAVAYEPENGALDYSGLVQEGQGLLVGGAFNQTLIGRGLAKVMQLDPQDSLRLTITTVDGAYNVGTLQVAGVYGLGDAQAEASLVFVPLSYAQTLLNTHGVSKVIVKLDDVESTDVVAARLRQGLEQAGLDLQVRTWWDLAEYFRQILDLFNFMGNFLLGAVSLLVFFIVLQLLTLAFLERTREIGTIRALGTKRPQVFGMLVLEGFSMGLLGGGMGLLLGWLLGSGFNALGVTWIPPGWSDPAPVRLLLTWDVAWQPFLVSVVATLCSSLYPAVRTARLNIVSALRAA